MSAQKADKTAGGPVFLVCRRALRPCRGSKGEKNGGVGAGGVPPGERWEHDPRSTCSIPHGRRGVFTKGQTFREFFMNGGGYKEARLSFSAEPGKKCERDRSCPQRA